MVPGDPGRPGLNVPRTVEEGPSIAPDNVMPLPRLMVGVIARGNLQSPDHATTINVNKLINQRNQE